MSSPGKAPPKSSYWVGLHGVLSHFLAWLIHRVPNERQRLLGFTILAGDPYKTLTLALTGTMPLLLMACPPAAASRITIGASSKSLVRKSASSTIDLSRARPVCTE
jgi:hypothetical protein